MSIMYVDDKYVKEGKYFFSTIINILNIIIDIIILVKLRDSWKEINYYYTPIFLFHFFSVAEKKMISRTYSTFMYTR